MNTLFPIFVKLHEIHVLLVGGGPVALEKISAILRSSPKAQVTVVAESVVDELLEFVDDQSSVRLVQRRFVATDLEDADLVVLATNDNTFNAEVRRMARERHLLINVADKPDLCDFYLGSIVQKGDLKLGISTNGKSPTMAKRVKEFLNDVLPDEIDQSLDLLQSMRESLRADFQEKVRILNEHTEALLKSRRE